MNFLLLADAIPPLPDPNHFASIGWVIMSLAALALMANQISDFFDRRSGAKNKREVSFEFEAVSKEEHTQQVRKNEIEHKQILDAIEREKEANQRHASERSRTLFVEIHKVRDETVKTINDRCGEQDKRIIRTLIGVSALCAKQGISMPREET